MIHIQRIGLKGLPLIVLKKSLTNTILLNMALYFISYDLRNGKDYQKLYDELNKINAVRMLESCWCFKRFNTDSKNIRDYFKEFIDRDDGLLISQIAEIESVPQWAGCNLDGNPNQLK